MQGSTSSTSGQGRGAVTRDSFAWSAVRSQLKESLAEFRVSVTGSRRLNLSGVQQLGRQRTLQGIHGAAPIPGEVQSS